MDEFQKPSSESRGQRKANEILAEDKRREDAKARADRVQRWLTTVPHLVAEAGLVVQGPQLEFPVKSHFSRDGVTVTIDATRARALSAIDLSPEAMDLPEEGARLLTQLAADLGGDGSATLAAAEAGLNALMSTVLDPERVPWLGGEERIRAHYLNLPEFIKAPALVLWTDKKRREALTQESQERIRVAGKKIRQLAEARLTGRSLKSRFRTMIPFRSLALTLDFWVEKALSNSDLDKVLSSADQELSAAVAALLADPRRQLEERLKEQIGTLERRVGGLPHIDLLSDGDIVRVVSPYYAGLDKAFKKKRAQSALVAVEERAREAKYKEDVLRLEEHKADYADVARYYPLARSMDRRLVLYVGPTNSGKTWRALNDLATGDSGAYLAPLRLLALEGQEEMEKRGKITSYITGEERDLKPGATFSSSTIEMMDFETPKDGVVIDEVQLLADERRGWAWLAAVLGAPAKRVIMTGSPDAVEMVSWLADYLGEPLEVVHCQRYNELHVAGSPYRIKDLTPGTALVCFSRREVLRLKELIEASTKHRVAVVYGNLSPQVRREEARRFREGEADVLVATDAIAMGLNLPIKEVVFSTTEKFDGESVRPLTPSEIKQIAGRAGRYGFAQFGVASALAGHDLSVIRAAIKMPIRSLDPLYYVAPGPNHVRIIGKVLGTDSLERILTFFERAMEFSDDRFARASIDELSYLATFVDAELSHMSPAERLGVAVAPVDLKSDAVLGWFLDRMLPCFALNLSGEGRFDPLDDLFEMADEFTQDTARGQMELRRAEDYLKTLTVYAWLAYRYPSVFSRIDDCQERREIVNGFIERSLRSGATRKCPGCGAKLPPGHAHKTCDACFSKRRASGGWGRGRR